MPGATMDTDNRVTLAEIKGDIKRIFDGHQRYSEDLRRMEQSHTAYQQRTDERLNVHSTRLSALESTGTRASGVREGVDKTLRTLYILIGGSGGVLVTGLAAVIARAKGL